MPEVVLVPEFLEDTDLAVGQAFRDHSQAEALGDGWQRCDASYAYESSNGIGAYSSWKYAW